MKPDRLFRVFQAIHCWADNVRRLATPRPAWRAEAEFAYYQFDPTALAGQLERQKTWQRTGHAAGFGLVQSLMQTFSGLAWLANKRVLEIGAGECMLGQALVRAGAREVFAVDAVPKQIWAAAACGEKNLRCGIADALDLPFADQSFDLVVANLVLHHIRPLPQLLSEVFRVLGAGGWFCALEPAPLCGLLVHEQTSDNEAPLWPGAVASALIDSGFGQVEHNYVWVRFATSLLGPFSPSYRIAAHKPGEGTTALGWRRQPKPSTLPGLWIDSGCRFSPLVAAQQQQLCECLRSSGWTL